jgi:hypothetical protein
MQFNPNTDGIDHINVYSKGSTKLGRDLSNFAAIGIVHPEYGKFASIEGFWYWLATGLRYDELRYLSGYKAKQLGKTLPKSHLANFKAIIKEGLKLKLEQHLDLFKALKESTLPLTHYYWYGDIDNPKIVIPSDSQWILDYLTELRGQNGNPS